MSSIKMQKNHRNKIKKKTSDVHIKLIILLLDDTETKRKKSSSTIDNANY